ncbi:uncharacterized protein LY79DRAFT_540542 [Colletotrichum navitas]|uniref:Uncharacterized protein n=1 Tax=Colletotrichum navitas TaxID=681940 RepID=A0AAD8V9W2_9PEZI|nr:uncharacterized protein LY79DRAFT_540542 [Colletotrichum navitas]KAK1597633.1 hypothetical protein LY79DRAFT_540542 [Colletotrichum navitas]
MSVPKTFGGSIPLGSMINLFNSESESPEPDLSRSSKPSRERGRQTFNPFVPPPSEGRAGSDALKKIGSNSEATNLQAWVTNSRCLSIRTYRTTKLQRKDTTYFGVVNAIVETETERMNTLTPERSLVNGLLKADSRMCSQSQAGCGGLQDG